MASGDGTIVPSYVGKVPEIPSQRAVIKHRNGVETLIVETSFDGMGEAFGWIIPVPNAPGRFEEFDPDFLNHLSQVIQPPLIHYPHPIWPILVAFYFLTVIVVAWAYRAFSILTKYLLVPCLIIVAVLFFFIFPNSHVYRGGAQPMDIGLEPLHTQVVGNYEIAVLRPKHGPELNLWLHQNGYMKLDMKAIRLVDDYVEKKWHFVAAKLIRKKNGRTATHPILIEFEAQKPIYPMRLTSLNGDDITLEIILISDQTAQSPSRDLEKIYTGGYRLDTVDYRNHRNESSFQSTVFVEERSDDGFKKIVGGKSAGRLMWNDCRITKFAGRLTNAQLEEDLVFDFETSALGSSSFRISRQTSLLLSGSVAYLAALLCLLLLKKFQSGRRRYRPMDIGVPAISSIIIFLGVYFALGEKTEVREAYCGHSSIEWDIKNAYTAARVFFTDHPDQIPTIEDLTRSGYKSGGCNILFIYGNSREDIAIEAYPLHGASSGSRLFLINADGDLYKARLGG